MKIANSEASRLYGGFDKAEWSATNVWIRSAECARETGAFLSICDNGALFPIANYALADDPGHALLLGLIAQFKSKSMSVLDVVLLNIKINLLGLLAISALLFAARCEMTSLIVLMLGFSPYFSWVDASPHPGLIGAAIMATVFPLTVLMGGVGILTGVSRIIFLALGAVMLGLATLLREPIGDIGLLISLGSLAYLSFNRGRQRSRLGLLILFAVALVVSQTPRGMIIIRDNLFPVQPASYIQSHGISHNLYIGLGAAGANKFGIKWDDSDGAKAVQSVDPTVKYVTPDYFRTLWRLYFDRVTQDPLEVVRIYAVKLSQVLRHRLPDWAPPLWIMLVGSCAFLAVGFRREIWRTTNFGVAPIIVTLALAFIGMFTVQGVLAHPSREYANPIGAFVLLILATSLETFFRYDLIDKYD